MEAPKVSVIVPVFNDKKYLSACLDSLLAQNCREIEIICTNDGSTDGSDKILEAYAARDPRIIVLNQANAGPGAARNKALEKAQGKYILFCDADDALEPDTAGECSAIMENTSCDMVVFNTNIIEDGRSVAGLKNASGEYITLVNAENEGALDKTGCIKIMLFATVWGKMFRAELINRYALRFSRHAVGEDARFLLSYLLILNSGFALNKFFYNYYLRPKSFFHAAHPWIGRFFRFPGLFFDLCKFTIRIGMPFRAFYFFYWLLVFFKSRNIKS